MFPVATTHIQVEIPGGFTASLSLKITSAEQLVELGKSLEACDIKPANSATIGKPSLPPKKDTPKIPDKPVKKPPRSIPAPATTPKTEKPMQDFIPQNPTEIIDIEISKVGPRQEIVYTGKTEDGQEIKIGKQHRRQMQSIGFDTSTWEIADPHLRETITVAVNDFPVIQQIKNPDGVWTWARQASSIREGETLCLMDDNNDISYHIVSKTGRMVIEFEGDHKPIENAGTCYICLTPPPAPPQDIPF